MIYDTFYTLGKLVLCHVSFKCFQFFIFLLHINSLNFDVVKFSIFVIIKFTILDLLDSEIDISFAIYVSAISPSK